MEWSQAQYGGLNSDLHLCALLFVAESLTEKYFQRPFLVRKSRKELGKDLKGGSAKWRAFRLDRVFHVASVQRAHERSGG